jgi:hypothetical protein
MRQINQLFALVLTSIALTAVTPASATQANRQTSARAGAAEQSDAAITNNLNRESLQAAQAGKQPGFTKASPRPRQTAQLTKGGKGKAIRRAIAIRRARAAKAKKAASG